MLEEAGDKVDEEEKTSIESTITDLEEALKGDNKDDIEAKIQKLTETSSELAQRMYAEQAQAGETADPGPASDAVDSDAVDAEFEEVKDDKQA